MERAYHDWNDLDECRYYHIVIEVILLQMKLIIALNSFEDHRQAFNS